MSEFFDNKLIGARIKQLRKNKKMSMKILGEKVGLHESTISRYEKGEIQSIDTKLIEKIANELDTTGAYLLGWLDYVVEEDKDIVEWALKNAPYTEINDEKHLTLKTFLNSFGYDLSVNGNGVYCIVGDEGALSLSKEGVDNLFNQTAEYLEFNIKKMILRNMQVHSDNER